LFRGFDDLGGGGKKPPLVYWADAGRLLLSNELVKPFLINGLL
jgi:hypothetical protein